MTIASPISAVVFMKTGGVRQLTENADEFKELLEFAQPECSH